MHRGELIKFLQSQPWADKSRRYHWTRREEYVSGLRGILSVWCVTGWLVHYTKTGTDAWTAGTS